MNDCLYNNEQGLPLTRQELIEKEVYFSVQDDGHRTFKITATLDIEWEREPLAHEQEDFDFFMVKDSAQPEWAKGQIVPLCNVDFQDWMGDL